MGAPLPVRTRSPFGFAQGRLFAPLRNGSAQDNSIGNV